MGGAQGFAIGSWHFALVSLLAVVLFRAAASPRQRQLCLAAFNLYFTTLIVANLASVLTLTVFLLSAFALAHLRERNYARWPTALTVSIIAGTWAFLFCVRDHALLNGANPFHHSAVSIVGISYIVFRAISYFLDREVLERKDLLSFLNYSLFFPSLLSGPIARQDEFIQSVESPSPLSVEDFLAAAHRIANGMIKKFVLADSLSVLVPEPANVHHLNFSLLWLGTLLCLFQLFLDFSGYSDIVIGLARLMGCHLPENFDRPFLARNIQEFWNRWHISLSSIIRDYFFMPLAKWMYQRFPRTDRIYLITVVYAFCMILIGVWHGTTEGYLLYGILNAGALIGLQFLRRLRKQKAVTSFRQAEGAGSTWGDWAARVATYTFLTVAVTVSGFSGGELWYVIQRLIGR